MAQTRTYTRSFAGGEVSPEMWGRIDDAKLQNFVALPQGPAENRPGTAFVREVKDSTKRTRLIPFTFSTTQTMVLEMGAGYFRFHTQGATIGPGTPAAYSTTKTISAVNTGTETFTSNTHGYANGTPVQVSATTTLPAPLVAATTYYVINAAANTYQLSLTATGSAIDITTAGSGTITTNRVYSVGNLVSSGGVNYYCIASTAGNTPPSPTYWYAMPAGIYEIPNPYAEADLFDIHYVQSADVMTLVHPNYAPRELRRYGATDWRLEVISFGATIATPTGVAVTANRGTGINIVGISISASGGQGEFELANDAKNKQLAEGDSIYITGVVGMTEVNDKYYIIDSWPTTKKMKLVYYQTGTYVDTHTFTAYTSGGLVQAMTPAADITNYYVITALNPDHQQESAQSAVVSTTNNLNVQGAYNTITWTAVSGVLRYNVYKRQNGLYGYIGQTSSTSFVDDNIAPDLSITPSIYDTVFTGTGNYPGAVSYFEQRKAFAGTTNEPQTLWMTRSPTENDMSYSIPTQDDDRIKIEVAVREASTIRHIVPLTQMLMLTNSSELRVSPINSDVITPSTISVRPQSYIGANNVQPEVVNNIVVYCADRGGHVRELGYSFQSQGFITGDLSLRSTHLFDNLTLSDMCYAKSPQPILWFISSSGYMLGLTYVPEQQLGAWHWHETDGTFESCTAIAEGDEDRVYVVVKRTINGSTKRYVERLASRQVDALEDCIFVDSALTYDGINATSETVTVSGGTAWDSSEVLTITLGVSFNVLFAYPAQTDAGDCIVITDANGVKYRLTIIATSSTTMATARVDKTIPVALRNVATTNWSFARKDFGGLSHLEGKTVSILADGAVMPQQVVTSGAISLQRAATKIIVGLPYESDLQTLPMTLNVDGFGQGRMKNVNKAWLRVYKSSGIFVGPDADHLVEYKQRTTEPYGSPPSLKSDELLVVMTPSWGAGGQVYIRQSDPLPLTLVGLTLEVSIGG
jgi:hypothetical protein